MSWEYFREAIPSEIQDQILREHFKFRTLKTKLHLGATDVAIREATVREYMVLSELTVAGDIPYSITSHRRYLGPIIVKTKRFLLTLINPIIKQAFQRQTALNQHLISQFQYIRELEQRVQGLERDIQRLRQSEANR